MRNIYTSIDIGTDTIKVIVCELFNGRINLLASSSTKSKGIKKGVVTDYDEAYSSLSMAIEEVETKLGIKIHQTLLTIPSYNLNFDVINGSIAVEGETITGDDVINVLRQGMKIEEVNMEMVTILPISFMLDGKDVTKDPRGRMAKKLESKSILITSPSKNIYNIMKLVDKCGLEVLDISVGGLCDMYALRNKEIANKVGVIVNIGSDVTNISLYNKGYIIDNKIVDIGGKAIDNDLSYIYKSSMIDAKKMKEKFAIASYKHASVNDIYDLLSEDGKMIKVNQQEITEIVVARLEEILRTVKKVISDLNVRSLDYIIFTGGTSNIPYLEYMLDDIFGGIAKIGRVNIVGVRNNKFTSCLGNIVYYISKQKLVGELTTMIDDESVENLTSLKKNMLSVSNESMLGKVVGYFFGE